MVFIIGDIHGEITKLKNLIKNIRTFSLSSEFVFIGDYLNKGEDPKAVLFYLEELKSIYNCKFLWGNHEYLWMHPEFNNFSTDSYLLKYGAGQTIKSFGLNDLESTRKELKNRFQSFFNDLELFWKNENFIAVHSGFKPEHFDLEIENIKLEDLIFNRFSFIREQKYYLNKYKIVFGHTGFYSPYKDDFKIGIDTAACFLPEQPLTAFSPESSIFIDSNNLQYLLNDIPLDRCPCIPRNKPWREIND